MMSDFLLTDASALIKTRLADSHKGNYGHALIVAGSIGMAGAAILATKSCLRSGAGLVTISTLEQNRIILQTSAPEAMCLCSVPTSFSKYNAIGCGCGLSTDDYALERLKSVLLSEKPLVLDADALNLIAKHNLKIPSKAILTPHDIEFDRITHKIHSSRLERINTAIKLAELQDVIVVLKGHRTLVIAPNGNISVNSTGNPGMATGGSGDVLTGIITSLLAQGYDLYDAARLGVFLHGLAGDEAAKALSYESLIAGDIINHIHLAFKQIHKL